MVATIVALALNAVPVAVSVDPVPVAENVDARTSGEAHGRPRFYAGFNPVAVAAAIEYGNGYADMLVPLFSNLEYGVALAAGWLPSPSHAVELRFSAAPSVHRDLYQTTAVYSWFPFERDSNRRLDNAYTGVNVRFWDYRNKATRIHSRHIAPSLHVGYFWELGPVVVDGRLSLPLAIISSSSADHTQASAAVKLSPIDHVIPVLPMLSVTVSYLF